MSNHQNQKLFISYSKTQLSQKAFYFVFFNRIVSLLINRIKCQSSFSYCLSTLRFKNKDKKRFLKKGQLNIGESYLPYKFLRSSFFFLLNQIFKKCKIFKFALTFYLKYFCHFSVNLLGIRVGKKYKLKHRTKELNLLEPKLFF